MRKMVVSSFYNTLIDTEEAIPTSTMLEVERIRSKGILFTVCTNRFQKEVLEYNRDFPFIDYIVSLNGSCIYEVEKGKWIGKRKISLSNIKKIETIFKDYSISYYTETEILSKVDYQEDPKREIYKIEIEIEDESDKEKLQKVNVNTSILYDQGRKYLEITSHKSSMFQAIDQISLKTGVSLQDITTICANESDSSLVGNIENSYIMENSTTLLQDIGKRKTKSNDAKGVEEVLKKL